MTPEQIQLIQKSFNHITPIVDTAADLFYTRLFMLDPTLRPLFKGDIKEQGAKLMCTLSVVVWELSEPDKLLPVVEQLGVRHANYGVKPEHYTVVGEALLWTLEQGLGDQFTPAVEEAWGTAYTLLANIMQGIIDPVAEVEMR